MERIFFVKGPDGEMMRPPKPYKWAFRNHLRYAKRFITAFVQASGGVRRLTNDEFISMIPRAKRKLNRQVSDSMDGRDATAHEAKIKPFNKAEKIECLRKGDPVARIIQPRRGEYGLNLGTFMRPIEHIIYEALQHLWKSPTKVVFKGVNAQQSGKIMLQKWRRFNCPVALSYDATRFDQHVSKDALKWEHSVYLSLFGGHDKRVLQRLLSYQLENRAVGTTADGYKVKYVTDGCRMSGDMNTALGNCLLMSSMMHSVIRKDLKIQEAEFCNNGDDCVIIVEKSDMNKVLEALPQLMLFFGFQMNLDNWTDVFEEIDFCQTRPVMVDDEPIMVRNVLPALAKDVIMLAVPKSAHFFNVWRNAVGMGGMSLTGGVPIMQSFYRCMSRGAEYATTKKVIPGLTNNGFEQMAKGMCRSHSPVSDKTRLSFCKAFGITSHQQMEIEKFYDNTNISWDNLGLLEGSIPELLKSYQSQLIIPNVKTQKP
jgi:hypothetical protein